MRLPLCEFLRGQAVDSQDGQLLWTDEENQGYIHDINAKCRDFLRLHMQVHVAA